eukprot:439691-Prymnesium_polylepis.1
MRHTRLTHTMRKRLAKLSCVSSDSFCIHSPDPLASVKGNAPSVLQKTSRRSQLTATTWWARSPLEVV